MHNNMAYDGIAHQKQQYTKTNIENKTYSAPQLCYSNEALSTYA